MLGLMHRTPRLSELRTESRDLAQADHGAGERGQGEVQVSTTLVAHRQAPEPGQPSEGVLDDPTVPLEMGAALDAAPRDAGLDAAGATLAAAAPVVVPLVNVQLARPATRPLTTPSPHALHGVQGWRQHHAVMPTGARQRQAERRTASVHDRVVFRARPAAIGPVGADLRRHLFRNQAHASQRRTAPLQGTCIRQGVPAAPAVAVPIPQPRATRPVATSTSYRSNPVRQVPHAIGCSCAARTGCQPRRHNPTLTAVRLWALAARAATTVQSSSTDRQEQGGSCPDRCRNGNLSLPFKRFCILRELVLSPSYRHSYIPPSGGFTRIMTARRLCVTFDDFMVDENGPMSVAEVVERMRSTLDKVGLQVIGFPIASLLCSGALRDPLSSWSEAGHSIGNHTFSHLKGGVEDPENFIADVLEAEKHLLSFPTFTKFFRFPFLDEGKSRPIRDSLRSLLRTHGYVVAPVTVDTSDWFISSRLSDGIMSGSRSDIEGYRLYYLDHVRTRALYYEDLARSYAPLDVCHVLLLHINVAAALFLEDLLVMLWNMGFQLIGAKDALDQVQEFPDVDTIPAGQSTLWSLAKARQHPGPLRYPAEDGKYELPNMVALGL